MSINGIKKIYFNNINKNLTVAQGNYCLPFDIKRIYFMSGLNQSDIRGKDAHLTLQQIVLCPTGACDCILDDGFSKEIIRLDNPSVGIHIKPMIWQEFTRFTPDCTFMVLASEIYDKSEAICDYMEFRQRACANMDKLK